MSWLFPAQAFTSRPARTSPGAPPKANQLAKSAAALSATSPAAFSDCCSALTTHRSVHCGGERCADLAAPSQPPPHGGEALGTLDGRQHDRLDVAAHRVHRRVDDTPLELHELR